ncbi:MAG: hypothetical protein WC373_13140 [Smithella sp.]|jgi:hypothetical protein
MKKINIKVNRKSILYLLIYGGIIFIVILTGILPLYLKVASLTRENDKLTYQIKEQKALKPVYAAVLNEMKDKKSFVLPHPDKTALPRLESGRFQSDFRILAKKSRLAVVSFTPDINSSAGASTSLYNVILKGELSNFRKMLTGLGIFSYLDGIEEINIKQGTGAMEFKIKLRIAIK